MDKTIISDNEYQSFVSLAGRVSYFMDSLSLFNDLFSKGLDKIMNDGEFHFGKIPFVWFSKKKASGLYVGIIPETQKELKLDYYLDINGRQGADYLGIKFGDALPFSLEMSRVYNFSDYTRYNPDEARLDSEKSGKFSLKARMLKTLEVFARPSSIKMTPKSGIIKVDFF